MKKMIMSNTDNVLTLEVYQGYEGISNEGELLKQLPQSVDPKHEYQAILTKDNKIIYQSGPISKLETVVDYLRATLPRKYLYMLDGLERG